MSLRLNGSTSGYSEIEAPAVAGDQTFTLPGTGGNLITDVSDLTTQVKSATNASGSAPIYSCRAWVNFDGTGTPAIRASGNVSSITDNGTGDYTVNFTTAMPDNDYCITAVMTQRDDSSASTYFGVKGAGSWTNGDNSMLTTSVRMAQRFSDGAGSVDADVFCVAIFR
jgi:hypothetical protein